MANYYINADTGSDSTGDGSSSNPWATITGAEDKSPTGTTLVLQSSVNTYSVVPDDSYTNIDKIQGDLTVSPVNCVIDAGNGTGTLFNDITEIKNVTIQNCNKNSAGSNLVFPDYNVTFESCILKDLNPAGNGIGVWGSDTGSPSGVTTIRSCLIYNCGGGQLIRLGHTQDGNSRWEINLLDCSFIFNNVSPTLISFSESSKELQNVTCRNNIFYNNQGGTINFGSIVQDFPVSGNAKIFDNNCYYGSWTTGVWVASGLNNITGDPLFIDAPNNDFRLRQGSPCIDNGVIA